MAIYICTVSNRLPENYQIGLQARTWGVEAKYKAKMDPVRPGDRIVFVVGGQFTSVHAVEQGPYEDHTPLWPPKDGDVFPYRVRISDAIASGAVPIREVQHQIGFLCGKTLPGPLQGRNGVLNPLMTPAELNMLLDAFNATHADQQPVIAPPALPPVAVPAIFALTPALLLSRQNPTEDVARLLQRLGLQVTLKMHRYEAGCVDLAYSSGRSAWTVVNIKPGVASEDDLLMLLRNMSWVRQTQNVEPSRGVIVAERADSRLTQVLDAVPNVFMQPCQIAA